MSETVARTTTILAVAVLWIFGWVTGVRGIDYGEHWDEWYAAEGTEKAVANLELFPGDFTYNGLYFDLAAVPVMRDVITAFPKIARQIKAAPTRPMEPRKYSEIKAMQDRVIPYVKSKQYLIDTRLLFMFFSSFVILGVAAAARFLFAGRFVVVVTAAALVTLSYEVGYHARYIAVDSLMCALSAVMLAAMAKARSVAPTSATAQLSWCIAALCGGLAFGSKVTGIAFCLPIGVGAFFSPAIVTAEPLRLFQALWLRLRRVALVAVVFVVTFLMSTPGFLRDPIRFAAGVYHTSATYSRGKFAYAVDGLADHVIKFFGWLFIDVPSPFWPFSLLLVFMAGLGARRLWRRDRDLAIAVAVFCAFYSFIILEAGQLVVRNALPLVPVLVLCIAAGVDLAVDRLQSRVRAFVAFVVVVGFAANAGFAVYAAESVRRTTKKSILKDTGAWLDAHADRPLWIAPRLYADLKKDLSKAYSCTAATGTPPEHARAALFFDEHPRKHWRSNSWSLYEKHFSSLETNLTYYVNWRAKHQKDRTVVMPTSTLQVNNVKTRGWFACTPGGAKAPTTPTTTNPTP